MAEVGCLFAAPTNWKTSATIFSKDIYAGRLGQGTKWHIRRDTMHCAAAVRSIVKHDRKTIEFVLGLGFHLAPNIQ